MRQKLNCIKCNSLDHFITLTNDLRPEALLFCGLMCEDCGHVMCCANCAVWEDENGVIEHEDYCIDKKENKDERKIHKCLNF